ncbi:MAG: hypothetical protein WBF17_00330 [Phycisphaerae bacterium]
MAQEHMSLGQPLGATGAQPVELKPVDNSVPIRPPASRSPFLTRGNLMLVAVFATGVAGLYALSLRNCPSTALADQSLAHAKVEAALDVLAATPTADEAQRQSSAKAIVNEFYTAARQRQIDVRGLKGNPFVFTPEHAPATQPAKPKVEPKPVPKVPDDLQRAMEAVATLKLTSVITGHSTVAMISSNVVAVGETIKGWTVIRIEPTEVELAWRDRKYVVRMSQ